MLERFAALLDRRARSLARGCALAGALFGAAVGSLPLTSAGEVWPVPHSLGFATLALGLAAGGVVGFGASKHRAGMLRLHAQTTLCQLHAQRTTLALWLLLKEQGVLRIEPELEPAPGAVPAPASAPEPVPPHGVEPAAVEPVPARPALAPLADTAPRPETEPEPEPELLPPALPPALEPVAEEEPMPPAMPLPEPAPPRVLVTPPSRPVLVPVHASTPAPAPPPLSPLPFPD